MRTELKNILGIAFGMLFVTLSFASQNDVFYFKVKNNLPKDKACIYADPKNTISIFYPGGPIEGTHIQYQSLSPVFKAIARGVFPPANLIGIQENTGIPCSDVNGMYPSYIPCQPNSFSMGRDNSCLNVEIGPKCESILSKTCLNPGFELQKGISTDGSYRYRVTGTLTGEKVGDSPICLLTIDWLKNWNEPANAADLGNHACK